MAPDPSFEVTVTADRDPGDTLLVGLSHVGMAGLTAADYLVDHRDSEVIGHVTADDFPAIAPFENGVPRHPMRLYATDAGLSVFVGELFVPVWVTDRFADAVLDWATGHGIEEIAVLHAVPFPHAPDEHAVFSVATPDYREVRLADEDIQPLAGGFLEGVVGELVTRGLDSSLRVGVFATPTHPPGPDIDAALLLLDTVRTVYGVDVDDEELRQLSEETKRYYAELADRMDALEDGSVGRQDFPEDRSYM